MSSPFAVPCEDDHNVHVICKKLSALNDDLEDVISKELPLTYDRISGVESLARDLMLRLTEAEIETTGVVQSADDLQRQIHRLRAQSHNLQDVQVRLAHELRCAAWVSTTFAQHATAFARADTNLDPNLRS